MGVTLTETSAAIATFAEEIGSTGSVAVVGAQTMWAFGGESSEGVRLIRAPVGISEYEPAEMTLRVGAGTSVGAIGEELAPHGQMIPFDVPDDRATVGGVLAVGQSGPRRRRFGHIRDFLLQVTYVNAAGEVIVAGGPTVKNVSGYDLCRLLVGSIGTLGLIGEVIMRCVPTPETSQWFTFEGDPSALSRDLFDASSVLWDGTTTWTLIEGNADDVAARATRFGLVEAPAGPDLPSGSRRSLRPADVFALNSEDGRFVAELGVGLVHCEQPSPRTAMPHGELHAAVKARLDPTGRLNPGRSPRS